MLRYKCQYSSKESSIYGNVTPTHVTSIQRPRTCSINYNKILRNTHPYRQRIREGDGSRKIKISPQISSGKREINQLAWHVSPRRLYLVLLSLRTNTRSFFSLPYRRWSPRLSNKSYDEIFLSVNGVNKLANSNVYIRWEECYSFCLVRWACANARRSAGRVGR